MRPSPINTAGAPLSSGIDPAARGDASPLSRRRAERGDEITALDLHSRAIQPTQEDLADGNYPFTGLQYGDT